MNFFLDDPDLVATFDRGVRWERIVPLTEGPDADVRETVATWREILAVAGRYIGTEVASRARAVDEQGVVRDGPRIEMSAPLKANLKGLADLGLIGLPFPREYGGSGLPFTLSAFVIEMLARSCPSTMVQFAFYQAPAAMILRYGTAEQKQRYLPRLARGEIIGAVAMTEPQAGSDVGKIATEAVEREGRWTISGRKQFISAGNGDFVIVLARAVSGSRGLDGLGLFIADRAGGNYGVERAEHKFTIRGSPTCALVFDRTAAEPLGRVGEGWQEILSFMNESRVGVGIQGLGIGAAALAAAEAYAAGRTQMDRPIREHPMIAEMLLDMETSVAGLRALVIEAAMLQDTLRVHPDGPARHRLRELTPLIKWYGAEEMIRVCRLALQIHGGYGVVTEYDVERHMRDSLILPIYEGTSQIQALMAVRDLLRAILRHPVSLVGRGPSVALARAGHGGDFAAARRAFARTLRGLSVGLVRRGGLALVRGTRPPTDAEVAPFLLHAERLTETLAHLHVARALLAVSAQIAEQRPQAARAALRARLVAERNRRAIAAGDGGVFARIGRWRAESR